MLVGMDEVLNVRARRTGVGKVNGCPDEGSDAEKLLTGRRFKSGLRKQVTVLNPG